MCEAEKQAEYFAWAILENLGYNYALSDVQEACAYLKHPINKEEGKNRCYCLARTYG